MRTFRFILTAVALSAVWFPILLLLPLHGGFIRSQLHTDLYRNGANLYPSEMILLFCLAGTTVAWVFRHQIVFAGIKKSLLLGCTLPYVSATVFLFLLTARILATEVWLAGRISEILFVLALGMLNTLLWLPIVAPIGICIQFALRWVGRPDDRLDTQQPVVRGSTPR